jgi:hypothetical protein
MDAALKILPRRVRDSTSTALARSREDLSSLHVQTVIAMARQTLNQCVIDAERVKRIWPQTLFEIRFPRPASASRDQDTTTEIVIAS